MLAEKFHRETIGVASGYGKGNSQGVEVIIGKEEVGNAETRRVTTKQES